VTALPARGEVWWSELPEIGRRPVVVLSRDAAIPRFRRALVAPCTTTVRRLPSEVVLDPGSDPVPRVWGWGEAPPYLPDAD
jgi:mRNA interferase MazF